MNPLGQRLLDRWDSADDHAGVTPLMLNRALDRSWITVEQHTARTS